MKRMIYAACAAATLALAAPAIQTYAATDGAAPRQDQQGRPSREERMQRRAEIFDARLVGFKASLSLTAEQEKAWAPFETALRGVARLGGPGAGPGPEAGPGEEPRPGDEAGPDRNGPPPSPIDRMRDISKRMGERSTALASLADAASPLYASLDARQKVVFDATLHGFLRPHHPGPGGPRGPGGPGGPEGE